MAFSCLSLGGHVTVHGTAHRGTTSYNRFLHSRWEGRAKVVISTLPPCS